MSRFGVGIIGSGTVAGEYIQAAAANPGTHVSAICSRTREGAKAKALQYGLKCEVTTDIDLLLARDDVDIVCIATPPHLHAPQAIAAAQAGKHFIVEKAMATTLEYCRAMRDAVAEAGVKSVVSFVLRWNPLFGIIRALLADNALGNVFLGEVDYFNGIGPWYKQYAWNIKEDIGASSLLSSGCHALDALRYFMGGEIVEVSQFATSGKGPDFAAYEYDPTSCTLCRFSDGRIGKVTSCVECVQPYVFNINLVGTQGTIKNNQLYSKKKLPGQTNWSEIPTILPDSGDASHHPFTQELAHLLDCIENERESDISVGNAYKTHEVCFAADMSGKEGRPVRLPLP